MPGSANFVGEFYILNGLFDSKVVFAIVAISGVAMSAYYALRLYQRTMHNRVAGGIASREIGWRDGVVLVPLVLCILGLALYPQLILSRTDLSASEAVASTCRTKTKEVAYTSGSVAGEPGFAGVLSYPECITPGIAKRLVSAEGESAR